MEFSYPTEQSTCPFPFCEIGLMTSNNYKVIELSSSKPKLKPAARISKPNIQPQLEILQVETYGRNICLIDQNKNLWFITYQEDYDNKPQNLSLVLGKKVNRVFVGQEEIIAKCDGKDYLIYLRQNLLRKLPQYILHKIPYRDQNSNPQRYTIYELQYQHGNYFLSYSQKYQKISLNMAYESNKIINIQTKQQFICEAEVLGVYFSKYHSVCWDAKGNMYSWGLRSSWIVETNDLIMQPKKIQSLDEQYIFSAVAEEYYCIALNREGQLIEWGIKNKIQIYPYQRIKIRSGFERMISVKGINKMYSSMGISGKIYFWGEGAQFFINGIPGNRQTPTPCKKLIHKKISDFSISQQYVLVISSPVSDLIRRFKILQLNGIKSNFKKVLQTKTNQIISVQNSISPLNLRQRFKTEAQRAQNIEEIQINQDQNEDKQRRQHLFKYIDSRPRTNKKLLSSGSINFSRTMQHNKMTMLCLFEKGDMLLDRINSKISGIKTSAKATTSQIKNIIDNNTKRLKTPKYSTSRDFKQNRKMGETHDTFRKITTSYDFRLKQVTQRKSQMDNARLNVLTQNTLQKRKLKKQALQRKKRQELLQMIFDVMMKDWLCRVLTQPIVGAKLMIVEQFRNSISFEMKVKRFQSTFFKKYIARRIQNLSPYCKAIVYNFLERTKAKLRKKREQKLTKSLLMHSVIRNLKQKIAHMILLYTFTIKKYQKIIRWFREVKRKKLLALRIKWNINLINSNVLQFKDVNMFSQFRNQEFDELQVHDIYQNFVKYNPQLKLNNFMDAHPIFRINFNFSKKIDYKIIAAPPSSRQGLTRKHNTIAKMMKRSKISKIMSGKKTQSRDNQFQKLKIYPYSQDYDQVIFSRKYNLKISQNVLKVAKWAQFQSLLLQKLLHHQLHLNQIHYLKQHQKYQIQMAIFIQKNYQVIQVKRSRYLLIPPVISISSSTKMKRQLDKMLIRAQKQYLLKQHMMQDRHIILDIALSLTNCPQKPILTDNLNKNLFKQLYTLYVGRIAKASRLFNVKNVSKLGEILSFN